MFDLIKINIYLLIIWISLMPFFKEMVICKYGGIEWTLSRIIGVFIIFINSCFIPISLLKTKLKFLNLSALFFFLCCCTTSILIPTPESFSVLFRIFSWVVLLLIFTTYINDKNINLIDSFIIITGIIVALSIWIEYIVFKINPLLAYQLFSKKAYLISYGTVRPRGVFVSAGSSAGVLAICLAFLTIKYFCDEIISKKIIFWGLLIVSSLALNFTRTYVICFMLFFIFSSILYKNLKAIKFMFILIIFFFIPIIFTGIEHYADRLKDLPVVGEIKNKRKIGMGRYGLWNIFLEEYKKRNLIKKFLGGGLSSTSKIYEKYLGIESSVHNDLLFLIGDTGIIGLLFYIIFLISLFYSKKFVKLKYQNIYLCFVIFLFILDGLFGGTTINVTGHRWIKIIFLSRFFVSNSNTDIKNRKR